MKLPLAGVKEKGFMCTNDELPWELRYIGIIESDGDVAEQVLILPPHSIRDDTEIKLESGCALIEASDPACTCSDNV